MDHIKALDIAEKAINMAYDQGQKDMRDEIISKLNSLKKMSCEINERYDTGTEVEFEESENGEWVSVDDIYELIKSIILKK